ncbi:MAG: hypothetical protein ABSG41_05230 [Bryobacteraceae bacterium]|jgi:hypothetical protein
MKRSCLLFGLAPVLLYGATDCVAPPAAAGKLKAYLSYHNPRGGVMRFSFASIGGHALFRRYGVPQHFDPAQPLVYTYREGISVTVDSCPFDSWMQCGEERLEERARAQGLSDRAAGQSTEVERSCDLSITIPVWRPSPDSPLKRKLAADLLDEIMPPDSDFRAVYVRDFNVEDPDVMFYYVDAEGRDSFQGCRFDASRQPHCGWHMFGQAPVESLKRSVMARPYKLFPPVALSIQKKPAK